MNYCNMILNKKYIEILIIVATICLAFIARKSDSVYVEGLTYGLFAMSIVLTGLCFSNNNKVTVCIILGMIIPILLTRAPQCNEVLIKSLGVIIGGSTAYAIQQLVSKLFN